MRWTLIQKILDGRDEGGEPCRGLSSTWRPVSCNIRRTVMKGGTRHTAPSVYSTQNFGSSALIQKYFEGFSRTVSGIPHLACRLQFSAHRVYIGALVQQLNRPPRAMALE